MKLAKEQTSLKSLRAFLFGHQPSQSNSGHPVNRCHHFSVASNLKLRWIALALWIGASSLTLKSEAAPHPATTTSRLISPQIGLYISEKGYRISASQTQWGQTEAPPSSAFVEAMYRPLTETDSRDAMLTVRIDPLEEKELELSSYMKKWLRDYPRYGFDVLAARPITLQNRNGYLVDLVHPSAATQLRQLIFIKNQKAAILTCRDSSKSFLRSLKSCNQIFRNFEWLE